MSAGRGRGVQRPPPTPEVEAAYQEYLRQIAQLEENRSLSPTGSVVSGASTLGSDELFSPFLPLGRGRGRGRSITFSDSRSSSPGSIASSASTSGIVTPCLSSPSSSQAVPSDSLNTDEGAAPIASFSGSGIAVAGSLSIGRGRSIPPVGSSETTLPLPATNRVEGRGRAKSRNVVPQVPGIPLHLEESMAALHVTPPPKKETVPIAVGVEDFSRMEREVVVKKGDKGLMIPLTANFIRVSIKKGSGLFIYHVDFEPLLDSVRMRRYMLTGHENVLGKVRTFDGAMLYLPFKLLQEQTVLSSPHPNDMSQNVTMTVRFVKENRMGECIPFYNILFRRIMEKLGMQEVNRHFYDYRTRVRLPLHRLEIWPGYVTAVDEFEGGLMLCCDSSSRVLRTSTLLDVYNDMYYENRQNPARLRQLYTEYVTSQIVLTRYNQKNYRVDDVDFSLTPKSTFTLTNGQTITYKDYYKRQYDIEITDLEQPLIIHRPKPNKDPRRRTLELVCLIPECCFMTGLTSELKKDHRVMRDVAEYTRLPPHRRALLVKDYVKNIKGNPEAKAILDGWGLTMEDAGIELPGRRIAPPNIIVNQNCILKSQINFGSEISKNPCLQPIPVTEWVIFCNSIDVPRADIFVQNYRMACRNIGIELRSQPRVVPVHGQPSRVVENFARTILGNLTKNLQFIVVIVPGEIGELYEAIKKISCVERPIPSQVVLSKTLGNDRQIRAIMAKIALQINCKLGGALWTIRIPLEEKIMFVGMDVYHDPRRRNPSVLALVGSLNGAQTKYFSKIVPQRSHQEVGDSLRMIFQDCVCAFRKESGAWPDRIVVFRDGVGDGQLEVTKETEVEQMLTVLRFLCRDVLPKFAFVVVQKRISCRIYAQESDATNYINPPPGTVLDHTVTRRYLFDFFLVSQLVLQGTVTPTHYIVLEDTAGVPPDLIQKFAFATSFLYYNWAGPIRVPAVCQYAHKLAFLVGQYVKETPSDALSSQLYYL